MKKYGLILTGKNAKNAAAPAPAPRKTAMSAFGGDDSDDEDELQARLQSERSRQYQASASLIASTAPELSDYDSFLAQKQTSEAAAREKAKAARKESKYIGALKRNAERRSFQLEQMKERQIQREQEAEKDQFGETERFVTTAYKAKLAADKLRAEEEARMEEAEKARDKAGMAGFYANLGRAQGLGGRHDGAALQLPSKPSPDAAPPGCETPPLRAQSARNESSTNRRSSPPRGRYEAGAVPAVPAGAASAPLQQPVEAEAGGGFDDFDDFDGGEVLIPGQVPAVVSAKPVVAPRSRSRSPPPRADAGQSSDGASLAPTGALQATGPPRRAVDTSAIAAAKARALARAAQRKGGQ